jgi:hypothetical protein
MEVLDVIIAEIRMNSYIGLAFVRDDRTLLYLCY